MRITIPLIGAALSVSLCLLVGAIRGPSTAEGPIGDGSALDRTRGWLTTTGFSPPEMDAATKEPFSWTGDRAKITIPRLNRRETYRFTLVVQAGRPGPQPVFPTVTVRLDGVGVLDRVVGNERTTLTLDVPKATRDALQVALEVTPTFVPSAEDRRQLGIVVRHVALTPTAAGRFPLPRQSLAEVALGAGLLSAVLALFAMPGWVRGAGLAAIAAASAFYFWLDLAMLGPWTWRLAWTSGATLGLALALRAAIGARAAWRGDAALQMAVAILLLGGGIKWWFFVHPQINVGDALFHVHRAEWVWGGKYFFTSITPRPFFEFPYAIGFYVAAWPFSTLATTAAERILLLRSLALLADVAAGLAVVWLARRFWGSTAVLVSCAVIYATCRMSTQVLFAANLTNLFAQALFTIAVAFLARRIPGRGRLAAAGVATLPLAGSFLSHFSTLMVGVPTTAALAFGMWVKGSREQKRHAFAMVAILLVSLAVAYGLYYSHFHDVYAATFARVASREGEAASRSIAAPPAVKAVRLTAETVRNFGWPLLSSAAAGLVLLVRSRRDDTLTRFVYAWTLAWIILTAVGVLTAVELRANLSVQPLVAVLAAWAIGWAWERNRLGAWLAVALTLLVAIDGAREWVWCVTGTP